MGVMLTVHAEAEKELVGCGIMGHPEALREIGMLSSSDFGVTAHREIVSVLRLLMAARKPIDLVNIIGELEKRGTLESIGGYVALTEISQAGWMPAKSSRNAELIRDRSARMIMRDIAAKLNMAASDPARGAMDIRGDAIKALTDIQLGIHDSDKDMGEILINTYAYISQRVSGEHADKKTGLCNFDATTGGLHDGEFTVIGARPGTGKSAFALQIASAFLRRGQKVEFVSREMSDIETGLRMYAAESWVDGMKLRTGNISLDEMQRVADAMNIMSPYKFWIDETSKTPMQVRDRCIRRRESDGLDLIVIDYLQLLKGDGRHSNRREEVGEISAALKDLARELKVPVLVPTQINRESERGAEPKSGDMRESGTIEQDADNIVLLWVDDKVDDDTRASLETSGMVPVRMKIDKQRQGPTRKGFLLFASGYATFYAADSQYNIMGAKELEA